jgi:hypothetical protein
MLFLSARIRLGLGLGLGLGFERAYKVATSFSWRLTLTTLVALV